MTRLSQTWRVSDTSVLDWITALGTLGAVGVAVWATIGSKRAIHRELAIGALVTRRREAMELLQAFQAIQQLRQQTAAGPLPSQPSEPQPVPEELSPARARYVALLRVSEEELPIAREDLEHPHNPQAELNARDEIVSAIETLNDRIKHTASHR
jgi:hypothetical protein